MPRQAARHIGAACWCRLPLLLTGSASAGRSRRLHPHIILSIASMALATALGTIMGLATLASSDRSGSRPVCHEFSCAIPRGSFCFCDALFPAV